MGMFNYVFLFLVFGVPELEICLRRPPAARKLEKLVKTTKSSFYLSFLKSRNEESQNPKNYTIRKQSLLVMPPPLSPEISK